MKIDNKTKTIIILSCLLGLAIVIICWKGCSKEPKPQYWQKPGFKTDTIKVPKPYPVKGDSFPYYVPPKVVIQYLPAPDNGNDVECKNDSLLAIIDSLHQELILIDEDFLTQFPESPKLVGGLFSKDTLRFDLLGINGKILSEVYLTDYNNYKYQWYNNNIRALELKKPTPEKEKLLHSLYVNLGYEVLSKKPFSGLDYYITYSKFKIHFEPKLTIESKPTLELNGKLGYRLK